MSEVGVMDVVDVDARAGAWTHPVDVNGREMAGFVWIDVRGRRWTAPPEHGGILLDEAPRRVHRRLAVLATMVAGSVAIAGLVLAGWYGSSPRVLTDDTPARPVPDASTTASVPGSEAAASDAQAAPDAGARDIASALMGGVGSGPSGGSIVSALVGELTPPPAEPRATRLPARPHRSQPPVVEHAPQSHNKPPPPRQSEPVVIIQHNGPTHDSDESMHDSSDCDC